MRPVCILLALTVLISASAVAVGEQVATTLAPEISSATHPLLHMQPPKAGTGFAYDLQTAGSVTITQAGSRHQQSVSLFAGLEIRWGAQTPEGACPAQLSLVAPHLSLGDREVRFEQPGPLSAGFDTNGHILWAQTPPRLRELGLHLTHLLLGIRIPSSFTQLFPGTTWTTQATLDDPASDEASLDIRSTYTFVGLEERRGRVYALVRGSLLLIPKSPATGHNYVGRLEAYLDPVTGRVIESATSLDVQTKLHLPWVGADPTEEMTVRMELDSYLFDLGPASIAPAGVSEPGSLEPTDETEPSSPTVISVSQPIGEPVDPITTTDPGTTVPTPIVIEITEPKSPTVPLRPLRRGPDYIDPAGRFSITLPLDWDSTNFTLTVDATSFTGPNAPQRISVYVDQAQPGSLSSFARSVLDTYTSSSEQAHIVSDLQPVSLSDTPAFLAHYAYPHPTGGEWVEELVFFGRYLDHNYILQYSDTPERLRAQKEELIRYFSTAFRLGPTPRGTIPVSFLRSAGTRLHVDEGRHYSLEVPTLWPAFYRSEDGSSITFAELGRNGYLTIYVLRGMERRTPDSVLRSWRGQWLRQEQGFQELVPMEPATLAGYNATTMSYEWLNADGRIWRRRVIVTIQQGVLYAVVIDYVAAEAVERAPVFAHILSSFRILRPVAPGVPTQTTQPEQPTESPATSEGEERELQDEHELEPGHEQEDEYEPEPEHEHEHGIEQEQEPEQETEDEHEPEQQQDHAPEQEHEVEVEVEDGDEDDLEHEHEYEPVQEQESEHQPESEQEEEAAPDESIILATGRFSLASEVRLEDPLSGSRVLVLGRLGEIRGDEITWLRGTTVRMRVGHSVYATRTDSNGYFAFANAVAVTSSPYIILGVEGPMFGYSETVSVTLDGVQATPAIDRARLIEAGYIIMERTDDKLIQVIQILPQSMADPKDLPRYFLNKYIDSGWQDVLRGALSLP